MLSIFSTPVMLTFQHTGDADALWPVFCLI